MFHSDGPRRVQNFACKELVKDGKMFGFIVCRKRVMSQDRATHDIIMINSKRTCVLRNKCSGGSRLLQKQALVHHTRCSINLTNSQWRIAKAWMRTLYVKLANRRNALLCPVLIKEFQSSSKYCRGPPYHWMFCP